MIDHQTAWEYREVSGGAHSLLPTRAGEVNDAVTWEWVRWPSECTRQHVMRGHPAIVDAVLAVLHRMHQNWTFYKLRTGRW